MSKKSKTLGVSASLLETKVEDSNPALVPKLRFPEFRRGKVWEQRQAGER